MNYYVICPYDWVTGGPDALHQMVYYLNKVNKNASIVYTNLDKYDAPIPNAYKPYLDSYVLLSDLKDDSNNIIIIPEFLSHLTKKYKNARVYIWWLSVDYNLDKTSFLFKTNLILTYFLRLYKHRKIGFKRFNMMFSDVLKKEKYSFKNEASNLKHICASHYAYDYVSSKSKNEVKLCVEPISKKFLDDYNPNLDKKDVVLYNPKKCGEFVEKIIDKSNGEIEYIPLINFNQDQLIDLYKTSKLYIDFGPFPGAERMPKEAVINGCSIITGLRGASKFYEDVLIKDEYKIEGNDNNIPVIIEKIKYVLKNYDSTKHDFDEYRNRVLSLEESFIESIKEL